MSEVDWEKLREKFPENLITKVDKGFGKVDTINHAVVTDRLIRYGGDWEYKITRWETCRGYNETYKDERGKDKIRFIADEAGVKHLMSVYGWMRIGGITRWEVGEVEHASSYGDEAKKAMSDFIKRAAMRFGVGLDLWTKQDLDSVLVEAEGATQAVAVSVVQGSGIEQGEGHGTASSDGSSTSVRFIGGKEANMLQKALGGVDAALKKANAAYGDEIKVLTDLTWEQARDLVAKEPVK